ncbi:phage tail protein [Aerosakkonemataceae cyanobacterium BLCC-F50]|uniref:Phage tail protein n=1 Tax=Floridaenema flaviceps BLCC-F50 TaxID=3153642 RepID=A0ABV4XJ58_9CYAN
MTQTNYRPTIALKFASMNILQATDASALKSFAGNNTTEIITNNLLLNPGKPSEILIELENLVEHSWRWKMEIEGDFPEDWCNWHQQEAEEIAGLTRIDKQIYFEIPEDFFESMFALTGTRSRLKLNYEAQIYIYAEEGNQRQLLAYRVFHLCVRPGSEYINFLPKIYREVDFIERLVTIFEQAFDPAVQTLEVLWSYLDPLTAPEAMLPFLAHWVAWPKEGRWDTQQQRRLIRNAIELYRSHGTRSGLRFYLHLYTGLPLDEDLPEAEKHIGIEEVFSNGFILGKTITGVDSMLGGGQPFHFIVSLRPSPEQPVDELLVREVIEREKPAFCTYDLDISYR